MSNRINKARYWWAVLYPENMVEDWQDLIGDILGYPYCYTIHDADQDTKSDHRKDHVHIIIVFPNTTTYKHAMEVFDLLSADGRKALSTCQAVINIRHTYDYLIHDTESCRKVGKEQYPPEARIAGNNFDIGCYEQLSEVERKEMRSTLTNFIIEEGASNMTDAYLLVCNTFDENHVEFFLDNAPLFERFTKSNYQKQYKKKNADLEDMASRIAELEKMLSGVTCYSETTTE